MNHPIDSEPETDPRVDPEPCRRAHSKQLKLLETLIDKIIEGLEDNSCRPKVRDALLAIKLQKEVAKTSEAEETFWGLIDNIRDSELSEPVSLEAQIKRTISSLAHQVRNGILPVKVITDAFNQDRSEQARLTCRRMSGLLSGMGFTKVRASNGARAIIWDDNRLSRTPEKAASSIRPPNKEVHLEDHQGAILSPPDKGTHSQDHQGAVLSPPDKGDLGGYDEDGAPTEDAGDHRVTIPGPGVCPSFRQSLGLSPPDDGIHPEDHEAVVLSPPDKGDLGGYSENVTPTKNTRDCRGAIHRARGWNIPPKAGARKRGPYLFIPASPPRPGVKS